MSENICPSPQDSLFLFRNVTECLHQLEAKYDLYQYEVDGWSAWAVIRADMASIMASLPWSDPEHYSMGFSKFERLAIAFKEMVSVFRLRKVRFVILAHASALREKVANSYKDIYFDDLLLELKRKNYFKIEDLNLKAFLAMSKAALIGSDMTSTLFEIASAMMAKTRWPSYISNIAKNLAAPLQKETGNERITPDWISQKLRHFYWAKKFYGWLFNVLRPEYLLMATYGRYPMVAAAKERRIVVIEFQHGSPNRNKTQYAWPSFAASYKSKIPTPDRIFLYGEYFRQELKANGFWDEELCPVGNLKMEKYRTLKLKSQITANDPRINILVTTQGLDIERIVDFMTTFLEIAHKSLKIKLYFKLQPNFEKSKTLYKPILNQFDCVSVLLGNEPPSTYELMIQADFHISIYSTTHYEALGLGIPTIILPFINYEIMLPLYDAGHAFLAQTPEDLFTIINHNRDCNIPADIRNFYLRPGALQNMKSALDIH
jgi:hypothetical protein